MIQRDVEVWLFHPASSGSFSSQIRQLIESECRIRGWRLTLRETRKTRTPEGRPLGLIRGEDVTNLYRRVHRARVGVWQIGDAHAPIKPRPQPNAKDYVLLGSFIRHKAFHSRISMEDFTDKWPKSLSAFNVWLNNIGCDNEGDPRCLPLHVFMSSVKVDNLDTQTGQAEFARIHGPQSHRVDHNQLHWKRGEYHGQDVLQIAGRDLTPGFHWDVSNPKSAHRITTTSDIWEIAHNGYVNVYPDQHIRDGRLAKRLMLNKKAKAR